MKQLRITIGEKTYEVTVEVLSDSGAKPQVQQVTHGSSLPPTRAAESSGEAAAPSGPPPPVGANSIISPMAGTVKSILVKEGDKVEVGQQLVILEAMKMENQIAAAKAGRVKKVLVTEGQSVQEAQALLDMES